MKWKQRIIGALLAGALCLGVLAPGASAAETPSLRDVLGIYTTGGIRGGLSAQDPASGKETGRTYLKAASAIADQRNRVSASLLLDCGDAVGNGVDGGGNLDLEYDPVALALRTIGYDALVPGVGEFRMGPEYREEFFDQLEAEEGPGKPVALLSANYLDERRQTPILSAYEVFTVEIGGESWRIGVAGLGAIDGADHLPEDYYEGACFSHSGNTRGSYAWEWEEYLRPALQSAENCDFIVVVCGDEDLAGFVEQTTGIDLVVGSRGEAGAWSAADAGGRLVPCISGGGSLMTRALVGVDGEGNLKVEEYGLLDLAGYSNDPALEGVLSEAHSALALAGGQQVGTLAGEWDNGAQAPYGQTDAFDLVARAMLWASEADGVFLNPSRLGKRDLNQLFQAESRTAPLTLGDCYALYPDSNSTLCVVELTGVQVKEWLDICAGRYGTDEEGHLTGGEEADALYGMDYELYIENEPRRRVENLTWQGEPIDGGQRFRIAVDSRSLEDPQFPVATVLWTSATDPRFAQGGGGIPAVLAAYSGAVSLLVPQRESTWRIYTGTSSGPMNRLEFINMLYELAGRPEPTVDTAFVDLAQDPAAVWAAECGIVGGDGQGRFLPTKLVTREQAAVILSRFAQICGLSLEGDGRAAELDDAPEIAAWAYPAVDFCYDLGIMPAEGNRFRPKDTFTRAEAGEFLAVLSGLLER